MNMRVSERLANLLPWLSARLSSTLSSDEASSPKSETRNLTNVPSGRLSWNAGSTSVVPMGLSDLIAFLPSVKTLGYWQFSLREIRKIGVMTKTAISGACDIPLAAAPRGRHGLRDPLMWSCLVRMLMPTRTWACHPSAIEYCSPWNFCTHSVARSRSACRGRLRPRFSC
jgi:hypothetical protein